MSDNGGALTTPSQLQIETDRVLAILREENPQALELAIRRATIEAQAKLIEELQAGSHQPPLPG